MLERVRRFRGRRSRGGGDYNPAYAGFSWKGGEPTTIDGGFRIETDSTSPVPPVPPVPARLHLYVSSRLAALEVTRLKSSTYHAGRADTLVVVARFSTHSQWTILSDPHRRVRRVVVADLLTTHR